MSIQNSQLNSFYWKIFILTRTCFKTSKMTPISNATVELIFHSSSIGHFRTSWITWPSATSFPTSSFSSPAAIQSQTFSSRNRKRLWPGDLMIRTFWTIFQMIHLCWQNSKIVFNLPPLKFGTRDSSPFITLRDFGFYVVPQLLFQEHQRLGSASGRSSLLDRKFTRAEIRSSFAVLTP